MGDAREDVVAFYAKRDTGTPVVYEVTDQTTQSWQVDSVPTLVFFDVKRTVIYRGKAVWADMAVAAEKGLRLTTGALKFDAEGTEYG